LKPDLKFLNVFEDKYLKTTQGRGVFLAGVTLGYIARLQVDSNNDVHNSPLFKQMHFGRITVRDLKKQLSRIPELIKAYHLKYPGYLQELANEAGIMILEGGGQELSIDGNFAFTVGFANASYFFWNKIYSNEGIQEEESIDEESQE